MKINKTNGNINFPYSTSLRYNSYIICQCNKKAFLEVKNFNIHAVIEDFVSEFLKNIFQNLFSLKYCSEMSLEQNIHRFQNAFTKLSS